MLIAGFWLWILNFVVILVGIILILLVLIQRGKGGGLVGALGGAGGSSAFGSRAGDFFTRLTLIIAGIWILLTIVQIHAIKPPPKEKQAPAVAPAGQ